ncbi:galactose mutarotase [Neolewinella aurantiaca]|uniref:Aldose 1-epimerase n=1 Tax=Neolewinella aurantiaca TaxID=2602767 RepID=A0A5C7FHE5_9BACT|nr:aldose epimerase family protein [Neolewinella aurantiaca]TXF89197.1 galactose mutarotase [Neolewinella aurantiaca]
MPTISDKAWSHQAKQFTLTNARGNTVKLTDYGATVTSIVIDGKEMVLGFDDIQGYLGEQPYFGATIGRYGNRIAKGQFTLDGETFQLPVNNGPNCLHGGIVAFDKKIWKSEFSTNDNEASVAFSLESEDGDEGFPGKLSTEVVFVWTNNNELKIQYQAVTTKPTVVNLTNHSYFNISDAPTIEGLELELKAAQYVPVDDASIPLGHLEPVTGSPFDFTTAKPVGQDLRANHPQIEIANGYDHTWVIDGHSGELREFALLTDPVSGRKLRAFTTEPGVQVFTANFAEGQFKERNGRPVLPYGAICMETQHFPDSPNQPNFPSTVLRPGEVYSSATVYRFE